MRSRRILLATPFLIAGSGLAFGQPGVTAQSPKGQDPTVNPDAAALDSGVDVRQSDAGSGMPTRRVMTMGQAESRLHSFGYSRIAGLHRVSNEAWMAEATRNGRRVRVELGTLGKVSEVK